MDESSCRLNCMRAYQYRAIDQAGQVAVSDVARTAEKRRRRLVALRRAGHVDGLLLVSIRAEHGIGFVGPVRPNVHWQAKDEQAYDIAAFTVEWVAQRVVCPQGRIDTAWVPYEDQRERGHHGMSAGYGT